MRRLIVIMAVLSLAIVSIASAVDDPQSGLANWQSEGRLTEVSPTSDETEAGNVTNIDITGGNISTTKWAGYYGDVSEGNLQLGYGVNIFYDFGVASSASAIFACQASSGVDWANLQASTAGAIDTAWSFTTADDDSATTEFTSTYDVAGIVAPGVFISSAWNSVLLEDQTGTAKSDYVFGANVTGSQAGFDGGNYEFELMVPVDGSTPETYYFYLLV